MEPEEADFPFFGLLSRRRRRFFRRQRELSRLFLGWADFFPSP
jgi:hypothetical protein